jgi:hypothetical protein
VSWRIALWAGLLVAQSCLAAPGADWKYYGGDAGAAHFTPGCLQHSTAGGGTGFRHRPDSSSAVAPSAEPDDITSETCE